MNNALSLPFVGSHELRKDLTRLLADVKKTDEPIVITSQGKPTAILTSVQNYNQLHEMVDELQVAIKELTSSDYLRTLLAQKNRIKLDKGTTAKDLYEQVGI